MEFSPEKREKRDSVAHKGTFWGLYVRSEDRRWGIGGALIREAVARARACPGVLYVRVVVTVTDAAALRLFEAQGFVRYGLEVRGIRGGGASSPCGGC